MDFRPILDKIGNGGHIIGVDFSHQMLQQAREKILMNKWENVKLIQADVINYENKLDIKADSGVCTVGLSSIIPDFKKAYSSLFSNIKDQGEDIIGDMQLTSGWQAQLNPLSIVISQKFGGTAKGHQNSLEPKSIMKEALTEVKMRETFMNSYYFCIGKKSISKPIGR